MIIDGKAIAATIQAELKAQMASFQGRKPCLAVLLVGENPASHIYVKRKVQACNEVGVESRPYQLPQTAPESEVLAIIRALNADPLVDGILVQLPLPQHVNPYKIIQAIDPEKDVDGFHPLNVGKLLIGETDGLFPCTPLGIQVLLERSGVEMTGKHAVIVGRSNIVGKPLAAMLMQRHSGANATVTVAHSHTHDIASLCRLADVLIASIGQPHFIKADMVKEGAVVIDVGINKIANPSSPSGYQIVGDVDFEHVQPRCALITPVPGGVGPMTIAMLLSNTVRSFKKHYTNSVRHP